MSSRGYVVPSNTHIHTHTHTNTHTHIDYTCPHTRPGKDGDVKSWLRGSIEQVIVEYDGIGVEKGEL